MDSEQERLQDGTRPTDSAMADINTKPLGGQRSRCLMNLIGYWHSENQVRVGEYERRVFEEKENFAGIVSKVAKMENGSVGGLAANGYRSTLEQRRRYPVWIGRRENGRDDGIQLKILDHSHSDHCKQNLFLRQ